MTETPRRICGTMDVHRRLLSSDPTYAAARTRIENLARRYEQGRRLAFRTDVARIPVVVHVVHNTAEQNLSKAQIDSQIAVVNRDYRGAAKGLPALPSAFREAVAEVRVEFELATIEPAGKPTDGVTRTRTGVSAFATDDSVKSRQRGGADPWPSDRYLNLWVCQLAQGVLGYAQLPGGPPATDGVVISWTAFGTLGTATAPFNLGRTATHEVGHWLNLLHIWGDDGMGCNGDDHVADTPNQAGPNYGLPTFPHVTCDNGPDGDMFVNFMDYTDDSGMHMFTAGQAVRMDATLDGPRATLLGKTPVPVDPPPDPPPPPPPPPVPTGGADLLLYDRAAGLAEVWVVGENGALSLAARHEGWRTSWDAVAVGDLGGGRNLLLYDRAAGLAEMWVVGENGALSLAARHESWRTSWDAVAVGDVTPGAARVKAVAVATTLRRLRPMPISG